MNKDNKVMETCKNLNSTIKRMEGITALVSGDSILRDNNIFVLHRPSKIALERKLNSLLKKYNINIEDL